MIALRTPLAAPFASKADTLWLVTAMVGVVIYTWLVFAVMAGSDPAVFGSSMYDEAFLAIQDGHLDLPARVLSLEGHFTPDGYGYLYHGLAPLLTRAVLSAFVDVATTPLGPLSIWFWSVLGSAAYHRAFFIVAKSVWPADGQNALAWAIVLAGAIWVGGPGLLLISNHSLYHEPIAVAYALSAGVVLLWTRAVVLGLPMRRMVIWMALLAAISVHARPNVAVGLYAVVIAACVMALWQQGKPSFKNAVLAIMILGSGGASYIVYNMYRFGDTTTTHGTFAEGPIQHAMTFWEVEAEDSARADAFTKHGRFNVGRIVPNGLFYVFEPPEKMMPRSNDAAKTLHRKATFTQLGKIRIESPGGGMLALWTGWVVLAAVGLFAGRKVLPPWSGLIIGSAAAFVVTCSYATITLRYHIDLWPLLAALALVGIIKGTPYLAKKPVSQARTTAFIAFTLLGILVNATTANDYRSKFAASSALYSVWSPETCAQMASQKEFSADRIKEICRAPRTRY